MPFPLSTISPRLEGPALDRRATRLVAALAFLASACGAGSRGTEGAADGGGTGPGSGPTADARDSGDDAHGSGSPRADASAAPDGRAPEDAGVIGDGSPTPHAWVQVARLGFHYLSGSLRAHPTVAGRLLIFGSALESLSPGGDGTGSVAEWAGGRLEHETSMPYAGFANPGLAHAAGRPVVVVWQSPPRQPARLSIAKLESSGGWSSFDLGNASTRPPQASFGTGLRDDVLVNGSDVFLWGGTIRDLTDPGAASWPSYEFNSEVPTSPNCEYSVALADTRGARRVMLLSDRFQHARSCTLAEPLSCTAPEAVTGIPAEYSLVWAEGDLARGVVALKALHRDLGSHWLFVSRDGGRSFSRVAETPRKRAAVALQPGDGRAMAYLSGGAVQVSRNGGATFVERPRPASAAATAVALDAAGTLYVLLEDGTLYRDTPP